MHLFLVLHEVASRRGDGLSPELVRLFEQRTALSAPNVVTLHFGPGGCEQAGPNPCGMSQQTEPTDVIRLPGRPQSRARGA
jgi:hypothetical protein